jgi:hypothetical protein
MRSAALSLALLLGATLPGSLPRAAEAATDAGDPAEHQGVRVAALKFLAIVDSGNYDDTWQHAGDYLRAVSTQKEWTDGLASARGPIGALQSRELRGSAFTPKLEDGRPGRYYTVYYTSRLGGESWEERVTLARRADGWAVEGYYIYPLDEAGKPIED